MWYKHRCSCTGTSDRCKSLARTTAATPPVSRRCTRSDQWSWTVWISNWHRSTCPCPRSSMDWRPLWPCLLHCASLLACICSTASWNFTFSLLGLFVNSVYLMLSLVFSSFDHCKFSSYSVYCCGSPLHSSSQISENFVLTFSYTSLETGVSVPSISLMICRESSPEIYRLSFRVRHGIGHWSVARLFYLHFVKLHNPKTKK